MTTEQQVEQRRDDLSVGRAVSEGIVRLRRIWPRIDGPDLIAEYRRVLGKAEHAETVAGVVEGIIDATSERTPPPPGVFAKAITEANTRRRLDRKTTHPHRSRSLDESALLDALAFVEGCTNDTDRAYGERQVTDIRKRLSDRGALAEARVKVRFTRGRSYPNDPPGTVRFAVVQPAPEDEDYVFPKGPKNGGAAFAALAPLALVVISGAWRVIG